MKFWTADETARLQDMAARGMNPSAIAADLGRTRGSIYGKAGQLKLKVAQEYQSKLSPTQDIEVWAWVKACRALGSRKSQARKMGCSVSAIDRSIQRMDKAEQARERASRRKFFAQLANAPF